ncbi:MAG TPA: efflux RND transporter periplasmic adaptor subunit, partial [Chthonomonadales bacterium]|nr:efflux RND transporter periplasmic adaptor subunit [Chthonomonadales bacterium]
MNEEEIVDSRLHGSAPSTQSGKNGDEDLKAGACAAAPEAGTAAADRVELVHPCPVGNGAVNADDTVGTTPTKAGALGRPILRQVPAAVAVLAALALVGALITRRARSQETPPPAKSSAVSVDAEGRQIADIQTGRAELESIDESVKTTGTVSFPSDTTVKIAPRLTGRVSEVRVKLGDHVSAGEVLAVVQSADAATAVSTLEESLATFQQADLDLQRFDRLQKLGTPEVTSAQAAYQEARAAVRQAKTVLDLSKQQEAIGGLTQPPLENAA